MFDVSEPEIPDINTEEEGGEGEGEGEKGEGETPAEEPEQQLLVSSPAVEDGDTPKKSGECIYTQIYCEKLHVPLVGYEE